MGNVTAPSQGLGSAFNYFLYSNCAPVTDLSVSVYVTQDISANIGLTIQLNAYPPPNAAASWQQFVFVISGTGAATTIDCRTDYFRTGGSDHVSSTVPLITLPNQGAAFPTVPAGYQLSIGLTNDSAGNILAATFLVIDSNGQAQSSGPIQPLGAPTPIAAFELNIVGPATGQEALLFTGAGTITYVATSELTVLNSLSKLPQSCITSTDLFTAESANSTYGSLPAGPYLPSNPINQTFGLATLPFYKPGAPFAVSQQIGLSQTNLYAVDQNGQIAVFSVEGGGRWSIGLPVLGSTGFARRGAGLAVSQQFGANQQTNLFVVDQHKNLQTFWTVAGGPWNGPAIIGGASSGQLLAVSQQFGAPNQTDLFLVDNNGTLNVYWAQGSGQWHGPVLVGPANHAPKHAPLAVSQQFGAPDQTDVFVVDNTGALTVFWVQGSDQWSAPVSISASGVFPGNAHIAVSQQFGAPEQTDVFAIDKDGQLTAYWVQASGPWNGPVRIGPKGLAPAGAPLAASQHFGLPDQTDVYVVDKNGALNVFSVQGTGPWSGGAQIGPTGLAPTASQRSSGSYVAACQQFGLPGQTDVFVINQTGVGGPGWPTVLWDDGDAGWSGPGALQTQV
jgi:hypothetical protein